MIMILGSSHDDVLYFESIMTGKKKEVLFDRFDITIGRIFNQEVLLIDKVYSNVLSSAVTQYILQRYLIILVFVCGKATAFSKDWKLGDIAISTTTYLADVDQTADASCRFGQVPYCPHAYVTQADILGYLSNSFENKTNAKFYHATYISTNVVFTERKQLIEYGTGDSLFGVEHRLVLESTLGGVALACTFAGIPFIGAKVISRFLDKPYTIDNYAASLEKYNDLGKAIVTTIGDIGRTDIVE